MKVIELSLINFDFKSFISLFFVFIIFSNSFILFIFELFSNNFILSFNSLTFFFSLSNSFNNSLFFFLSSFNSFINSSYFLFILSLFLSLVKSINVLEEN